MRRRRLIVASVLLLGLAAVGASRARGYFSSRPEACTSCHEMTPRLEGWKTAPHRHVARCVDCHVPPGGTLEAIHAKATDGARHGAVHVAGQVPPFIHVKREATQQTLQANCLRCHRERMSMEAWRGLPALGNPSARTRPRPDTAFHADPTRLCSDCHRETGHGPRGGA